MNDKNWGQMEKLKQLRQITGLSRKQFAEMMGRPLRTVEDWEAGRRTMAEYLLRLLSYKIHLEYPNEEECAARYTDNSKNVTIITDCDGKKIVFINDIRFKGKRNIDWESVEEYLKEYVGSCYEIAETSDKIYIGTDFPDEFSHSRDTKSLNGANAKAKANATQAVGELIQIATNKSGTPDYQAKHKSKAKNGWYRYDVRFALPIYSQDGYLKCYNIYAARMLIRHDADGKMYLYDILRTKKETSKPLEQ